MKLLSYVFGCLLCLGSLQAANAEKYMPMIEQVKDITFAIPDEYAAASKDTSMNVNDGFYWGDPQVLNDFFKDTSEIPRPVSPVIQVKLSPNVIQKNPQSFEGEDLIEGDLKQSGFSRISVQKTVWGNFPVLVLEARSLNGEPLRMAWMGMNQKDGKSIAFYYVLPSSVKATDKASFAVWDKFIKETH